MATIRSFRVGRDASTTKPSRRRSTAAWVRVQTNGSSSSGAGWTLVYRVQMLRAALSAWTRAPFRRRAQARAPPPTSGEGRLRRGPGPHGRGHRAILSRSRGGRRGRPCHALPKRAHRPSSRQRHHRSIACSRVRLVFGPRGIGELPASKTLVRVGSWVDSYPDTRFNLSGAVRLEARLAPSCGADRLASRDENSR